MGHPSRVIRFNPVQFEGRTKTMFPVWVVVVTDHGAFTNMIVLDQEEAADLQQQINDKFQVFDLTEAENEKARIMASFDELHNHASPPEDGGCL